MKKAYNKPQIVFDSFELSQSIAAGCEIITKLPSENACGVVLPGDRGPTFVSEMTGCKRTEVDGDYNGICYHVPNDANNVFSS